MGSHDIQEFCLRWNNHHSTLVSVLDSLLVRESLVDVILAAEGKFIKAHRFVLFACSNYFQDLLSQQLDKQAVVFMKDVRFADLKALVDFMYRGEVNISQYQLESFLQTAEALQIKGLADKPQQKKFVSNLVPSKKAKSGNSSVKATIESTAEKPQQQQDPSEDSPAASHPTESQTPTKSSTNQRPKAIKRPAPKEPEEEAESEAQEPPPLVEDTADKAAEEAEEDDDEEEVDMDGHPEDNSDQESIKEEDEGWSAGNSQPSFDGNSASDYPSGAASVNQEGGNETWASENHYDLTMSDSSLGGDGGGADGGGLMVIEDEDGGERPFSCPRCGRRYKRKNNAVAHLRYECGVVPSFPCPICSHMLSQRRYIQKHIRRKHPDYIQEYEDQVKKQGSSSKAPSAAEDE